MRSPRSHSAAQPINYNSGEQPAGHLVIATGPVRASWSISGVTEWTTPRYSLKRASSPRVGVHGDRPVPRRHRWVGAAPLGLVQSGAPL